MEPTQEERDRIFQEELSRRQAQPPVPGKKNSPNHTPAIFAVFILVLVSVSLSFVHIVWNVPGGVVIFPKLEPSLSDTFVNYNSLTGIPKIIVLAQHPSVVKGLEEKGLIQWDNPFQSHNTPTPTYDYSPKAADLKLLDSKSRSDEYSKYVVGTIQNNSSTVCSYATVSVDLLDEKGNRVGSTMDNITNLGPGEKWKFKALITSEDAKSFHVSEIKGTLTQ